MGMIGIENAISNYAEYSSNNARNKTNENIPAEVTRKKEAASRTENNNIKNQNQTVADYSKHLQERYAYMNKSTTMEGIPTTVTVSTAFIKKCASDPEKAKFLEENLRALPDCAKRAVAGCQGTLTSLSYKVDDSGNISVAISGSSDPDGRIAKENAEKKAAEKREKEKKAEEKKAEKKCEEKLLQDSKANEKENDRYVIGDKEISDYSTRGDLVKYNTSGTNFNSYV